MSTSKPTSDESSLKKASNFSLILGGPLYQFFRRAHLAGDAVEILARRVVVISLLAWLPLLVLSIAQGQAWGVSVQIPFLYDLEMHLRLLLALPLLIVGELVVHRRMRVVVEQFLTRGLITDETRAKFDAVIASAMRLRNSVAAEVLLIAFVYGVGVLCVWRTQVALDVASWYGVPVDGILQPTWAGWWLGCVSLPLFQFLLLRWYFRLFIWARFLWHVSRLELNLIPTHPDRCAGLGFLTAINNAFAPILLAQGVMLSGMITNRIVYYGAKLTDFKFEVIALVTVMVFAVIGPLLVFLPRLAAVRRNGIREYGTLAQSYVREFDQKWLRGGVSENEPLLGSADVQSLADLDSSYNIVKDMKIVPFTVRSVLQLAAITLLPVAPLLLTMISVEQIFKQMLKIVF